MFNRKRIFPNSEKEVSWQTCCQQKRTICDFCSPWEVSVFIPTSEVRQQRVSNVAVNRTSPCPINKISASIASVSESRYDFTHRAISDERSIMINCKKNMLVQILFYWMGSEREHRGPEHSLKTVTIKTGNSLQLLFGNPSLSLAVQSFLQLSNMCEKILLMSKSKCFPNIWRTHTTNFFVDLHWIS